jgi:hypothetical protein
MFGQRAEAPAAGNSILSNACAQAHTLDFLGRITPGVGSCELLNTWSSFLRSPKAVVFQSSVCRGVELVCFPLFCLPWLLRGVSSPVGARGEWWKGVERRKLDPLGQRLSGLGADPLAGSHQISFKSLKKSLQQAKGLAVCCHTEEPRLPPFFVFLPLEPCRSPYASRYVRVWGVPPSCYIFRTFYICSGRKGFPLHVIYSEHFMYVQGEKGSPFMLYIQNILCMFREKRVPPSCYIFRTFYICSGRKGFPLHVTYSEHFIYVQGENGWISACQVALTIITGLHGVLTVLNTER